MKTLTPDYKLLELGITPDYSPRVPKVRLPSHIREKGRQLVQHRLIRAPWEGDLNFYQSLIVPLSPTYNGLAQHLAFDAERGQIEPIEIDDSDSLWVVDAGWGEIPAKASFPVQLRVTSIERGQIDSVSVDDSLLEYYEL